MNKLIVMDANILIRGILSERVSRLLERYSDQVQFFTAAVCYEEVRRHLPAILEKRGMEPAPFLEAVDLLEMVVVPLDKEIYGAFEAQAKQRIAARDEQDWPLLALALALDCPVWTEDNDFFGTGVVTWHSQNVEIYLGG
ncbi:MAG: PIN domain-containing protein [Caldilineaceae bacterium]|nr:PIN domain-containing protein [Caldilineaceae bacterium]